jgi:hypothetical protein
MLRTKLLEMTSLCCVCGSRHLSDAIEMYHVTFEEPAHHVQQEPGGYLPGKTGSAVVPELKARLPAGFPFRPEGS